MTVKRRCADSFGCGPRIESSISHSETPQTRIGQGSLYNIVTLKLDKRIQRNKMTGREGCSAKT